MVTHTIDGRDQVAVADEGAPVSIELKVNDRALFRLMQLSSAGLPVGGYSFSQGLEYAIDCGWVCKQDDVHEWLEMQLLHSIAQVDLPALRLLMIEAMKQNWTEVIRLNDLVLACRETKELRLTDTAMGEALVRLLNSLDIPQPFAHGRGTTPDQISFVSLFAIAASHWEIDSQTAALGFAWSWLENQVAAATKLVPLGQTQSQILLGELQPVLSHALMRAQHIDEEQIGAGLPALAIASALHEQQYSRLFRS
ncbi:MAG: urease accessory protein UreF [Oceanospirillaceae bacterium]|uniref:urease accessory protein UreF n=2 Tax=Neptuniibacter TaxID=459520 RepID=UPI000C4EE1C9|nr:urease accessory protein UreF [Oceanospirillaceae bacterium]|tara:strand:+ start:9738 stop:10496 length:759 start_codon:yes stop_codon:yes gene_type:complete